MGSSKSKSKRNEKETISNIKKDLKIITKTNETKININNPIKQMTKLKQILTIKENSLNNLFQFLPPIEIFLKSRLLLNKKILNSIKNQSR